MRVIEEVNIAGELADELERNARTLVRVTIKRIEARYKGALSGPRSGREYRKSGYKGKVMHLASAPGEAPATDTGNLAGSIYSRMTGKLVGESGSTAEYAAVLELGGAHIEPRPALTPAVKAEWPEFEAAMKTLIRDRGDNG
jgi:hypothetical protein